MKDLKNKLAIVSIITLVFFICLLLANGDNKHLENKVVVKEATVKTLMEGTQVSGNSTLKYKLKYKLESDTGETINNRIAIVDVILNEEAKKYITFTKVEKENITSEIIEDGKILRIRHQNVTTNKDYELELTVKMNNAPNGYTFSPRIEVKDAYGQNKNIQVEKTTVETTSVEGKVLKNNKSQSGIRITLCKMVNNLCVNKRETYSREDGTYTFSDIEEGNYKLETEEGYEIKNNEIDVIEGNNVVNIDINTKQNFKAKIRKYIKEVEVNENGTTNKYNFDKKQKVNIPIKGKSNIKLSILYEFEITNTSNEAGFVKVIKENTPEGMELDKEYFKNKDWKENNGVLYNKTLSKHEIKPNETKKVTIKLNTTNTSSAKKYLNKVSITGEIYHSVKYIVEDEEVKNLVVVDSDKVNDYNYTKDGYVFEGWYKDKEYKEKFNFNTPIEKDTIIYGKIKNVQKKEYKIIYKLDNDNVYSEETVDEGNKATKPKDDPIKVGYKFIGWKQGGSETLFDFDEVITENKILYAVFEKNKYTVRFINEGEEYNKQEIEYKGTITKPIDPEKKYYRFVGWYEKNSEERFKVEDEIVTRDITLYAKYEVIKYTVRFYDNDKVINEKTEYEAGSMIDIPSDPEKEGYTFIGWYKEGEDNAYNFVDGLVTEDVDLYSKYEKNKYVVTFYNENEEEITKEEVEHGERIKNVPDTNKKYYRFVGWYEKGETENFDLTKEIKKNTNLYAKYEVIKYTVRFYDNNKVINEKTEYEAGSMIDIPSDPEKEGYTFKGWYKEGEDEEYNFVDNLVTENVDLYSRYEINKYKVEYYDVNPETKKEEKIGSEEVEYNKEVGKIEEIERQIGKKTGYTLVGWIKENKEEFVRSEKIKENIKLYTKYVEVKNGVIFDDEGRIETKEVQEGKTVEKIESKGKEGYTFKYWSKDKINEFDFNTPIVETITLYAVYEINSYTLIVNPNGGMYNGSLETKTYTLNYGEEKEIENPTKEGYTFTGWTVSKENVLENNIVTMPSSDVTLEANYEINSYTLTVNPNGGMYNGSLETKTYTLNYGEEKEIENPTKEGYTFTGWTVSKENVLENNIVTMPSSDVTLEANYEINSYTLTVNPNGGMYNGSLETKTYTLNYGEEKEIENPTKEGYTFTGWTSTVPEALNEGIVTMPSSNVTLEANYEINSYTLTVNPNGGVYNGTKEETVYNLNYGEEKIVENPTKEGYTFTGWTSTVPEALNEGIVTMPSSNVTLEANYEINKYTVTFINEGEEYNKQEVEYKGKVTKPEEPEKEGYTFKYWSKDKALEYNLEEEVTEDVTLYSVYEINKYTVTFENEGQVYETRKVNYKEKVSAPEENPRKENNIFRGWNKENTLYDFESEVISDITLNAVYEEVEKPVISHEPISWTNDKVMVTVTNDNHPEYSFKYKIDNGEYKDYTGPFEVLENSVVTGISIKENVESKEEIHEIKNIDKIKPTIISLEENSEIKSAVSAKVKIKAKDEESGIKEIKIYVDGEEKGSIEKEEGTVSEQTEEYEITGLEELTSYRVKIKVIDYAGNEKESDEIEVTTIEKDYVAQIVKLGEEDKSESPIRKETLEEAIEYCNITECTIQMIKGTTENVEVLEGQKIKLDLNGQIVRSESGNTIINTGDLTIIDNGEAVGQIISEQGIGVQNRKILTVGENEEELVVSTSKPNIIGNITGIESPTVDLNGSHAGVEFKFLDGRIEGNVAITGTVTETPYLYNTKVESGAKQVATLTILAEAEARINTTYYTKVSNAMNESKKGHYEESSETVQDLTKLSKTDKDTEYGFKYDEETGKLISTNQGIQNSVSNSYIKIDLSDYTEDQILTVNAEISSESGNDIGYATVTEDTTIPAYNNSTGRFIYISGEVEEKDYKTTLTAGKIYYLHFGYRKDNGNNTNIGKDTFTINSIKLGYVIPGNLIESNTYSFKYDETSGVLTSTNQGIQNSVSNSYIKIDLTKETEDKTLILNAKISSSRYDYGYATMTESAEVPYANNSTGRFIYISGEAEAKDYKTTLTAGKIYYLHLGYNKSKYDSSGNDIFTINSIKYSDGTNVITGTGLDSSEFTNVAKVPVLNEEPDTIELLKNITLLSPMEIEDTRDVVLDLRGQTLTTQTTDYVVKNHGSLKIIDSKYTDDIESAQKKYEEEEAENQIDYDNALSEYNKNKNKIQNSYDEKYKSNLNELLKTQTTNDYVQDELLMHVDALSNEGTSEMQDISGNGNNGTMNRIQIQNNAFNFSGSTSYANFGKATDIGLTDNHSITLDMLISFSNGQGGRGLLSTFTDNTNGFMLGIDNNNYSKIRMFSNSDTSSQTARIISKNTLNDGNVHHLVGVYDCENKIMTLYIDGKLDSSKTFNSLTYGNNNLVLGATSISSQYFIGNIYNAKIYNKILTEDEINQNYIVDKVRYEDASKKLTSNTSYGTVTSSNEDGAYKVFDGNTETSWTSNSEENYILWQMPEEKTVTGFKIYGSSESSKYPKEVELLGSKDGENYDSLVTSELEQKGLNEYNTVQIETNKYDSYKYFKWKFKNDGNEISINEIDLDIYNISRKIYNDITNVSINNSDFMYNVKNTSNSSKSFNGNTNVLSTTTSNAENMSVLYYNKKITVKENSQYTANLKLGYYNNWSNSSLGTVYIGFSKTNERNKDDFDSYVIKDIDCLTEKIQNINVGIYEPGEYYFKIIVYHNSNTSGSTIYNNIYNLQFTSKPTKKETQLASSTHLGNITSTTGSVILNDENANLVLDSVEINLNKTGSSGSINNYSNAITNYGTLTALENSTINTNSRYSALINNEPTGRLLKSSGKLNINYQSNSYGIYNVSRKDDFSIDGFKIFMKNYDQVYGIYHVSNNDLAINNIEITGSGSGIYKYNNNSNLSINDSVINGRIGVETGSNSNNIKSSNVDIINTNINYNDTGIINNYSYSTINIKNSNINGSGNGIKNYEKGIVNFYSGTIKSRSYPNVLSYGTEFNIYGGYFESTSYCLSNTRGTMNITGGEVLCGGAAIQATYYKSPGGTVNIGGTFKINSQSKGAGIELDYSTVNIKDSVEIFSNTTSAIIVGNTSDNYTNNPTTLNILGNNIIRSSAGNAIYSKKSKSVINIGTKDGNANKEYPKLISSKEYPSLYSSAGSTNYYDGIITGKKGSSIKANIEDSEDGYDLFINDNGNDLEDVVLEKPTLEKFGNVAKIDDTYYPSIKSAVEALPDSEEKTIELLKDVRTIHQNIITDTKNGILDLNGKKITKYSLSPIFENNGIFKIKDSTTVVGENNVVIDGAGSLNNIFGKILENNGTLDFDSGTIITENQNNQAIINSGIMSINGGYISANSSQSCYRGGCTAFDTILNNENSTLKVTGGTLYKKNKDSLINNSGILEITDGNFIGEVSDTMYLVTNSSTGNVSITGGTYNVKASSYGVRLINNSGEANISNTTIDLFNILNNTGNITLTNVTAEKLDRKQCMENTGILNINGGKYILNGSDYYNYTIVENSNTGQLNMENVDITADSIAIKNSSSNDNAVNIKSGKFNSVGKYSGNSNNKPTIYSSNGIVTIGDTNNVDSDGNKIVSKENPSFISNGTSIEITGGKLNFYDGIVKGKTVAINGSVNEVEEGYELIKSSDDDYTEIIYLDKLPIVQVVGEDNPSYSIEEALETESCNGKECELDLLRKASILSTSSSIRIPEDKNVILDLNGYDISSSNELLFINNGTLKFKDSKRTLDNETISGTITSVSGKILENNGTFEYESGTISTENTNKDIIVNNNNMTISGGTISSTTNERNSKFNVIVNNENATLNITGGNLYKDELGSIVENSGILNITGGLLKGTISGYNKLYLVSTTSTGKTTITGGTYEGDGWNYGGVCVLLNQGVTNVTGINITSQMYGMKNEGEGILSLTDVSMDNIKFSAISNENGTVIINSGTFISQDYNGQRVGTIENSGGTVNVISGSFSGSYYGIYQSNNGTINIGNTNDLDSEGNKLVSKENPNIKGNTIGIYNNLGTLNFYDGIIKGSSSAISGNINDVEEGYAAVVGKETIDSTEFETKYLDKLPVAKIKSTDKEYYSLKEAVDESNDNDTIEILRNVTYSTSFNTIVIEENKNIKIDLNGYVITTPSELFENNGTLELIDSKNTLDENGYITSGTGYIVGSSNGIKLIDNKGTLKVSGAKIIGSELRSINVNPITNSGDLIINSGYVSTKKDGSYSGVITATVINNIENGNITMNGGMIESYGSSGGNTRLSGIIINNTSTGLINLLGGKFYTNSNTNVTGIKNSANCNIIINGAELNKVDSINSTDGTIKIVDGVINGDIDNDESSNLTIDNGTINGNVLNRHVNSSITINGGIFNKEIGSNNGVLNITNGIFNDNVNHNNINIWNGKVNITGGTYNATNRIISNDKGTINISNVTFENCSIGISQSGGTTNVKENTIINASDKGINISGGILNIGEKGNVSFDDPSITGTNYGVYNTNGKIYFYDGIIKGKVSQSITGVISETEPGYKIRKTTENEEVESSILEIIGTEERAIVVNGINFIDLQAAINAVPDNTETTMELYSNIILNSDIVIPEGKIINLYYRGYKITKGNYTITNNGTVNVKDEDTSGGILGTIKTLLNIEDNNISKNIIVYQMDDGSILSSVEDYTLESLVNGKYEKIDVEEVSDEVGRYNISSNKTNTLMTTINGRIYLNNITSGSYKLVSSSGKEISFEISDEGTLSSNIKENFSLDTNKILSLSTAEIITSIRTGQTVIRFGILISLISVILSLLIIAKRQNEKYL